MDTRELEELGYLDLRAYVYWIWGYFQIEDNDGNVIMRISTDDKRVTKSYDEENKTVNFTVVITGYDAEFGLPVEIGSMSIYKMSEGGDCLGKSYYTDVILEDFEDIAVLHYKIRIPGEIYDSV